MKKLLHTLKKLARARTRSFVLMAGLGLVAALLAPAVQGQTPYASRVEVMLAADGEAKKMDSAAFQLASLRVARRALPALRRGINVQLHGVTVEQALTTIAREAGLELVYDSEKIAVEKPITLEAGHVSAYEALRTVLYGTGLGLKVLPSGQLVLVQTPEADQKLSGAGVAVMPLPDIQKLVPAKVKALQLQVQTGTITGTVTDSTTGAAMPGVNVIIAGTQRGAATGAEGRFTISDLAPGTYDLIASFIGYASKRINGVTVTADDTTVVNIALRSTQLGLEEVVVVGYGTQKRANLTGAVSTVDLEKAVGSRPVTDLGRALQGAVPGLTITTPTGEIGTNPSITLRGVRGSLNTGTDGAEPLILLDGVEIESLNMVNPSDVESISVLKDAASAAIYGTRAAWGVILITTKSGQQRATPRVTYSNNFAIATPTTDLNVAPAAAGAEMAFKALKRANPSTDVFGVVGMYFDQEAIQKMREWEQKYGDKNLGKEMVMGRDFEIRDGRLFFYRPWDAGDMYLKEWTPMQKHDLSVSGGSEDINYYLGLGYISQSGVLQVNTDEWQRYSMNLGVTADVTEWMEARGRVIWSRTDLSTPFTFHSSTYDPWYYLYRWPATYPYGTYEGKPFRSAITEISQAQMSSETSNLARVSVGTTLRLSEGLTIDADYTYSNVNEHIHRTGGSVTAYNFWPGGGELNYETFTSPVYDMVEYTSAWDRRSNFRAYATYQHDLGAHSFELMGGTDTEIFKDWNQYSERRGLLDPTKGEFDLATGDQFVNGSRGSWSTLGVFGRINYSFRDRYLIQLNGRMDASSRFPTDDQWAFFPSFSLGYIISEESFMDFARPVLSFLKFRGSWGSIGNQDVGSHAFLATMGSYASDWLINDSESMPTFETPGAVSPSLTWETVTTLDLGVDARLFQDRLGIKFDWYRRTTSGMLTAGMTLPSTFGTSAPERNYGEMQTTGWELEVSWRQVFSNGLYLNVTGSLSDFQEKITKFANTTKTLPNPIPGRNYTYYEGMTIGEIWGYETAGFFTKDDFKQDADGNLITDENGEYILKKGVPSQEIFESGWFFYGPGDIQYRDLNGDGVIDYGANTVDDHGDMKIIGNSTPRYQYGLSIGAGWKGVDVSVFIQGVGKRDFWANGPIFIPGYRPHEAWFGHQTDYWTPKNQDAYYPRPTDQAQSNDSKNFLPQTKYLLDLSYMRLKNVTIGYTLPSSITQRVSIDRLRVYMSGANLFEFEDISIPIDPEMDYTQAGLNDSNTFGRVYPFQRKLSLGLEVTL